MRKYIITILFLMNFINFSFAQKTSWNKLSEGLYRVQGCFAMELCNIGCCSICFNPTDQIFRVYRYLIPLDDILKNKFSYDSVLFFGENLKSRDSTVISKYKLRDLTLDSVYFELNKSSIITVYSGYMKKYANKTYRDLGSKRRYNGHIYYQVFKCDFIVEQAKPELPAKAYPLFKKPKRKGNKLKEHLDNNKPISYRITNIILINPLPMHSTQHKWTW